MSLEKVDVVIVGGGIAGCMAALALGRQGIKVRVLEKSSQIGRNGAEFLKPRGIRILERYNLLDKLMAHQAYKRTIIRYYHQGELIITYDYQQQTALGYYMIIPYITLIQTILDELDRLNNVTFQFSTTLKNVTITAEAEAEVVLENEHRLKTQVIIATDGRHSFIRNLFQIPVEEGMYHQQAYMAAFPIVPSVKDCNRLYFNNEGWGAYFYPLPPNTFRVAFIVPTTPNAVPFPDTANNLVNYLRTFVSESEDALASIQRLDHFFKLSLTWMQAQQYTWQNIIFLGATVLEVHPMTGQGMNVAIEDAHFVSQSLISFFEGKITLSQALTPYHTQRRLVHRTLLRYGNNLATTYNNRDAYLDAFDFKLHGGDIN